MAIQEIISIAKDWTSSGIQIDADIEHLDAKYIFF